MYQPLVTFSVSGGYRPSQSYGGPDAAPNTLFRGKNYWLRPYGRLVPVLGVSQRSATSIGPRIFPLDQYRGVIAGALVSSKVPKASLVRYNQALFFLSEETSKQIYINEAISTTVPPTGPFNLGSVTTSSTAGKLRVAILSGSTYTAYDAGLDAPASVGTVSLTSGGSKSMDGIVSVVAVAKRLVTQTLSNPSPADVQTMSAGVNDRLKVTLPVAASGQDAWLYAGTYWGQGNFGPWRVIREVRVSLEGTVTINNTNSTLAGTSTRFLRDLRVDDVITIGGVDYTIATITSDTAATLTVTPGVNLSAQTATMKTAVLQWRNGELGELIDFDNDIPPILDGLMLFNNVPFGWKGNILYPTKIGSAESFPRTLARGTQSGADIIHALAGDARIYLLTTNGLEVVTFTQNESDPFLIRQAWAFGFSSPNQALVAEGTLYAAVGTASGVKIVRTRVDDSPDLEFSAPVESDMASWNVANVVMGLDPANGAVLAMHYSSGTGITTVIPYMLQQGVWGLPQEITGQVTSAATVSNGCELIIKSGTDYTVYQYEGGNGSSTAAYVAWPFIDKDGWRQVIKDIKATLKANTLYVFKADPGVAIPDITNTANAAVSFTLTNTLLHETLIQTNVPNAQSFSIRVDSTGSSAVITEVVVSGLINKIRR